MDFEKDFKDAKTLTGKGPATETKTIAKLTKGKTYYVRVRGVNGDKTGKWSKAKKVTIRK
mgnify:CR=1 FL=1